MVNTSQQAAGRSADGWLSNKLSEPIDYRLTPQKLYELLKRESDSCVTPQSSMALSQVAAESVLLLDIRPREAFLTAHIKAPAVVNIEPVILREE